VPSTSLVADVTVSLVTARAEPKSATLTTPSARTRTFSGLTSRWIEAGLVSNGERLQHRLEDVESGPWGQSAVGVDDLSRRLRPGTYSMTRKSRSPSSALVEDPDDIGVGESGRRARASRWKRSTKAVVVREMLDA
jgi:hypothetical protein